MVTKQFEGKVVKVRLTFPNRDPFFPEGISKIEIRGDLPGITWDAGLELKNGAINFDLEIDKEYQYKYIVYHNGGFSWEVDSGSDSYAEDGYGGHNSVISTKKPEDTISFYW